MCNSLHCVKFVVMIKVLELKLSKLFLMLYGEEPKEITTLND